MSASDVEHLNTEIDRLTRELDQASSERNQSAQYGLELLKEKGLLVTKCEDLELLYDNAKHELEITQEVNIFFRYYSSFLLNIKFACTH